MPDMSNVPILGRKPLTTEKEYVVELRMASGARHRLTFGFHVPTGPDGVPDLGALQKLNPEAQSIGNIVREISKAATDPVIFAERAVAVARAAGVDPAQRDQQPVTVPTADGMMVVWRYVESFQFLGSVEEVEVADKAAQAAKPFANFGDMLGRMREQ